jgi:hypothetical protein
MAFTNIAAPAFAQAPEATKPSLKFSGTSRFRYEAITGQARTGFNDTDNLLNIRTTLALEWRKEGWTAVAEVYDSRAYLANRGTPLTTNEINAVELVQAYVGRTVPISPGTTLSFQAGRMMLNLGSRRLVAADDYRNTTNSYTGVRADLKARNGWSATGIYTLPQRRLPDRFESLLNNAVTIDRESFDLVLWGGLALKERAIGPASVEWSFFHLGERDTPRLATRDRSLNTIGVRVFRDPSPSQLDYELEVFSQRGRARPSTARTSVRSDVSASFVHAEVGYSWATGWKPRLSLEYDRASGDAPGGRYGRFDTLLGMRRAELAPAGLYNAVGRANFSSPAVRLEISPDKRTDSFLSVRPLWLAERRDTFSTTGVRDASGAAGNYVGEQIDARLRYWAIPKRLRLEVDGVLLRKSRWWSQAPNSPGAANTRYVSANATVQF